MSTANVLSELAQQRRNAEAEDYRARNAQRQMERDQKFYNISMQHQEGLVPDGYGGYYDPQNPLGEGGNAFAGAWGDFSKQLSTMTGSLGKMYGKAFNYLDDAKGGIDKMYGMADQFQQEFQNYRTKTEGLQNQAYEEAGLELGARGSLRERMVAAGEEDMNVGQRAITDAEAMGTQMREDESRRLMSVGVDPTSQNFGGMAGKDRYGVLQAGVLGANTARRNEKDRANQFSLMAYQAIDPSKTYGIASNIQSQGNQLLDMKRGMITGAQNAQNQLAGTAGNMAGSYGSSMSNMMNTGMNAMTTMASLNQSGALQTGGPGTMGTGRSGGMTAKPGGMSIGRFGGTVGGGTMAQANINKGKTAMGGGYR